MGEAEGCMGCSARVAMVKMISLSPNYCRRGYMSWWVGKSVKR
jgi:hypothetical protein